MSNIKYPIDLDLSSRQIKQFQSKILDWYKDNKRNLPWRETRDPYKILVSEVMLQQTQVSRVIPKYEAWLGRFPDVQSLANAKVSEVLTYWSGLGYNRRALYLLKCASTVASTFSKELATSSHLLLGEAQIRRDEMKWPQTEKELMKLPGIGRYTARALLCFAFDKQITVVDTNIRRVILTQFHLLTSNLKPQNPHSHLQLLTSQEIEQIAEQLLPVGKAYEWNQALMDYSSAMLKHIPLRKSYGGTSKIPIPKQSKFKDSDRFYRGAIIRFLLKHQRLSFEEIVNLFAKDNITIENTRLERIIRRLQKDRLIILMQNNFYLP